MEIVLSDRVKEIYPNMTIQVDGYNLHAICRITQDRCLAKNKADDDFAILNNRITRVLTALNKDCATCPLNK